MRSFYGGSSYSAERFYRRYETKTRLIFALKNFLSYLSYIFKSNSIGKWSDLVFLWHNKHIGHPKKPTSAFFWDKFLYSHLKSRKFVEYRDELYGIYEKKVSESLPDFVKRFDIPKNEWKNMNYYFISVPADKSHSLVKFCIKKDVPVFQLWDLEKIDGLPVGLKEFSKSLVFLPFTNRTRKKEAEKACEIIIEFFNINH
jgi:hypothetical protein